MKQVFLISMLFLARFCIKVQPTEHFDPEFADIDPFLNGSQLTPKAASERLLNMLKRVERLEDRLVSHLKLVKEYVAYHHMSPDQQNFVVPSWDASSEFFDLSDYNHSPKSSNDDAYSPNSSMNSGSYDSMQSGSYNSINSGSYNSMNNQSTRTRYTSMNEDDERQLKDEPNKNFVDFLREVQTPKPQELTQQSMSLDHPMLHNYGTISQDDLGFNELKAPLVSTPSEELVSEQSNENKDSGKSAAQPLQ